MGFARNCSISPKPSIENMDIDNLEDRLPHHRPPEPTNKPEENFSDEKIDQSNHSNNFDEYQSQHQRQYVNNTQSYNQPPSQPFSSLKYSSFKQQKPFKVASQIPKLPNWHLKTSCGSPFYAAPELVVKDVKSDQS